MQKDCPCLEVLFIKKIPNARGYTIVKGDPGLGGETPAYYQVATLFMDSREAIIGLLSSPEGQVVSADVLNFATGGVTFLLGTEEDALLVESAGAKTPIVSLWKVPDQHTQDF